VAHIARDKHPPRAFRGIQRLAVPAICDEDDTFEKTWIDVHQRHDRTWSISPGELPEHHRTLTTGRRFRGNTREP
jgi:hypothetical protein